MMKITPFSIQKHERLASICEDSRFTLGSELSWLSCDRIERFLPSNSLRERIKNEIASFWRNSRLRSASPIPVYLKYFPENMLIAQQSKLSDIDEIFRLYRAATQLMREKGETTWPEFNRNLVISGLRENRQFKFLVDGAVACVWTVTYSDPEIWGDLNDDPAVYIHRIATNPKFRGRGYVSQIVAWAKIHAESKNLRYIRMDTCGENHRLIAHYEKHGFDFLGLSKLEDTDNLPEHYHDATVSLFQIALDT